MAVPVDAVGLARAGEAGCDLRQCGKILVDLGSLAGCRQHMSLGIDDIGHGVAADLGIADIFGKEAQVDLGHGDADAGAAVTGVGHGQRDERPAVAEIGHRIGSRAARQRVGEAGVAGEIDRRAVGDAAARQAQLLAALGGNEGQLADGRDLVEELGVVGAALLVCRSRSLIACSIRRAVASALSAIPVVSEVRVAR